MSLRNSRPVDLFSRLTTAIRRVWSGGLVRLDISSGFAKLRKQASTVRPVNLSAGGVQLTAIGIMGEYIGRIFNEVKKRPLYLVNRLVPSELEASPQPASAGAGIRQYRAGDFGPGLNSA